MRSKLMRWGSNEKQQNIIWEVGEHKLGIWETKETNPTVMEYMICYYLFTSHVNQIVLLLNFSSVQSRYMPYWDGTVVNLVFSCIMIREIGNSLYINVAVLPPPSTTNDIKSKCCTSMQKFMHYYESKLVRTEWNIGI